MYPVIGQLVDLYHDNREEPSKVHISDNRMDFILINVPIDPQTGGFISLKRYEYVFLKYIGVNGSLYELPTTVLGFEKEGPVFLYNLHKPAIEKITKIQRREYFRVPVNLKMELIIEPKIIKVETVDISGGGVKFLSPPMLIHLVGETIECNLYLPTEKSQQIIFSKCKIVRFIEDTLTCQAALTFIDMERQDRERIIRYCFQREMELRKRGRL